MIFAPNVVPGDEPENSDTHDWALWRGQMALFESVTATNAWLNLNAISWLGEVRGQLEGGDTWPDHRLVVSLDTWLGRPRHGCDWMTLTFPSGAAHDGLAKALYDAHRAILKAIGCGRGHAADIPAMCRIANLMQAEHVVNCELAEGPTWCHTIEVWVRG